MWLTRCRWVGGRCCRVETWAGEAGVDRCHGAGGGAGHGGILGRGLAGRGDRGGGWCCAAAVDIASDSAGGAARGAQGGPRSSARDVTAPAMDCPEGSGHSNGESCHSCWVGASVQSWCAECWPTWFGRVGCCRIRLTGCDSARRSGSRCACPACSTWARNFSNSWAGMASLGWKRSRPHRGWRSLSRVMDSISRATVRKSRLLPRTVSLPGSSTSARSSGASSDYSCL